MSIVTQGTLPFKRASKGRRVVAPEKQTEAEADFELSRHDFRFLNTTVRYPFFKVQCPHCRQFHQVRNTKGTGQSKGIADRLVYSPRWWHPMLPATLMLGIELKGSKTPFSSPEQKALIEEGRNVLARTGEAALVAARGVDAFFAYVEVLESAAADLLVALRDKSQGWRDGAKHLAATLQLGGEVEARRQLHSTG